MPRSKCDPAISSLKLAYAHLSDGSCALSTTSPSRSSNGDDGDSAAAVPPTQRPTNRVATGTHTSATTRRVAHRRRMFISAQMHSGSFLTGRQRIQSSLRQRQKKRMAKKGAMAVCKTASSARVPHASIASKSRMSSAVPPLDTLKSMIDAARASSILSKDNVNPFRRRSEDFFDDFDVTPLEEHDTDADVDDSNGNACATTSIDVNVSVRSTPPKVGGRPDKKVGSAKSLAKPAVAATARPAGLHPAGKPPAHAGALRVKVEPQASSAGRSESPIEIGSDSDSDHIESAVVRRPLTQIGSNDLFEEDYESLSATGWLTGSVINSFLHLLTTDEAPKCRTYSFSTFFYTKYCTNGIDGVRRWCRKVNLAEKEVLLFPIHVSESHWSLVVVRIKPREISYYDSLNINGTSIIVKVEEFLQEQLKISGWKRRARAKCWKQHNAYDCGVHLCRTAFLLTTGQDHHIQVNSHGDTTRFRQKIKRSLKGGRVY